MLDSSDILRWSSSSAGIVGRADSPDFLGALLVG